MTTKNEYPNPVETRDALQCWHNAKLELGYIQAEIEKSMPSQLVERRQVIIDEVARLEKICRHVAKECGGYKGDDGQCYWQKRDNGYYDPRKLRNAFYWAGQAIHEVVDEDLLKGFAKRYKVTEEQLKEAAWEPDIRTAFILK